jgi:molybdate transport repressor ModE-like protein
MSTGALIVASLNLDAASKGNEEMDIFLPMVHLEGTTVIKREISILRRAGVSPIIVLCGYQKEVLKNHLSHNGVIFCEDGHYESHNLETTIQQGLDFARTLCDRVLVVPVERPMFSVDTVRALMECASDTVPVYQTVRGFPWLHVFQNTQQTDPLNFLEVEDEGIRFSMLDPDGMEQISAYAKAQRDASVLQVKMKVILTKEIDFFGPGIYQLLRNIDELGSIQAAAARMKMSYSKGWKMVNKVEAQMGFPFLNRSNGGKKGGSSTLTEEARIFLARYQALTEDIRKMSQNFFDQYFQDFQ